MGFVYAFYDNDSGVGKPIYIGRSDRIQYRLQEHFGKRPYLGEHSKRVMSIRYAKVDGHGEMDEAKLINKYRPELNIVVPDMRRFEMCNHKCIDLNDMNCLIRRYQLDRRYKIERLEQD